MKTIITIFTIFISILVFIACGKKEEAASKLNLDFEKIEKGFPVGWEIDGDSSNYLVSVDSTVVKSGKYSMAIESKGDFSEYKSLSYTLPNNYDGKQITLSGYIKTENVTSAGLGIRIEPQVGFDCMYPKKGISGTTDWTKYEITLDMHPAITEKIVIGVFLFGNGKMWLDSLNITIDGVDAQSLKPYHKKPFPAEKDHQFDSGSNIVFPELDDQKIADLELLGKIWGFLKYYHPTIGQGKYNWDYELFRILPSYLNANNNEKRDRILLKWIDKYGAISTCKTCIETPKNAVLKPYLSWVDNSNMNQKLKSLLHKVYLNRNQGSHFYIRMIANTGSPMFMNENTYSGMPYPDGGFRLLSLFRYWNMIHYFFPYKHLTDKNWNEVLKEYILPFVGAKNELEYELTTTQLIGEVCDTHACLWGGGNKIDSLRGGWYPPFRIQFIENKFVVTGYYSLGGHPISETKEIVGLQIGDIITHINGKPIDSIIDSIKKYYPASNEAARMRDISNDLLRSINNTINITYESFGQIKEKKLTLYKTENFYLRDWNNDNKKCYKRLDNNIGYVTLGSIKDEDITDIKQTFKNTKGIIIDIRNYPSSKAVYSLVSYFVSLTTPFVKFTCGNVNNPGEFTFSPVDENSKLPTPYRGKLVVIINELTQSAAELVAMACQVGVNTTVIGSQTAGADGNVSGIVLPGGLNTCISGIGIYYPDGRETQRIGIVPDIEVKPTIKGIREGRDELLEKAIEIIKQ